MLDETTLAMLKELERACANAEFYKANRDLCIAARIALLNIKGKAVKLRPSLLGLEELSDRKAASYVIEEIKREVGPVADSESIKEAAAAIVYKKLRERI